MASKIGSMIFLLATQPPRVPVYNLEGSVAEEVQLPRVFGLPVRIDLIRRAFLSEFTARLQPKGRDPLAGKRTTARSFGVGLGIARVPRIPGLGRAAFINSAVGGHLAHPPRVEKKIHEEINKKEKKLATASALAATARKEFVEKRGHRFPAQTVPVIVVDEVETSITRVKEAKLLLEKLGVWSDIERAKERTRIRAGKGKRRGRRYITPKSILFIVSNHNSSFARAVAGLPGVDVAEPWNVNVLQLAPGGVPGRLTVITRSALEELGKRFDSILLQI
ncbi:50S ribosomal protein L4 [Hyperthermus butylicus]|uniref:Large ribosomal subunit protein uL4 n=1 Tax=Hyperthermus butylicus (strain DSM 5456 / JCM 9403 / PLM1-5) TaxID=415426 RepID=A2BMC2_HYPBU|nr:50S ribosomal protein L4 [Hyperthermus butylicus DSM 5456]